MKKQRGLNRYYRKLEFDNDFNYFQWLNLQDVETWQYMQHWHFDHKGYGNNSFKKRKPHLDKLFRHFEWLSNSIELVNADFQLYAVILDFESSSDALFLNQIYHGDNHFNLKAENLSAITTLRNESLNHYLGRLDGYEKLYGRGNEAFCLIYIKNTGKGFL
jgi:hypothetical protein